MQVHLKITCFANLKVYQEDVKRTIIIIIIIIITPWI
jgi:hypothetical protein